MDEIMSLSRPFATTGLLIFLGILPAASSQPALGQTVLVQSTPMEVTTDTPEYCQKLLGRINELIQVATRPIPREASDLTAAGRDMCEHGQTRGGIMRLRSAIMIIEKNNGPAYR